MKKLGIIITLLLTLLCSEVFAARDKDQAMSFSGIPFGATRETVIEELMKMGYQPYGQSSKAGERVVVPIFKFGELPVQVDFLFNSNEKLYSFEIRTGRVERARLSKAFDAVEYMSEQFTLKYGKPSGAPAIDETYAFKDGVRNFYQKWYGVRALDVNTAIVSVDGRYYTIGQVLHHGLAEEKQKKETPVRKSTAPVF